MREIKFRAWDGHSIRYFKKPEDFKWFFGGLDGPERTLTSCELMQYTGLSDKNGNDIYEGDIVLLDILNTQNSDLFTVEDKKYLYKRDSEIVSYQNGAFGYSPAYPELNHIDDNIWTSFLHGDELWSDDMEVIGNIYENPELIR